MDRHLQGAQGSSRAIFRVERGWKHTAGEGLSATWLQQLFSQAMNPLSPLAILNHKTKNFQKVEENLTTERVALQRRNQLYSASSCFHSPPTSNAQPLPQILSKLLQGQQPNTPLHSPKTTDPLAKKGRSRTGGQIHPPQQSVLLSLTHIFSLMESSLQLGCFSHYFFP